MADDSALLAVGANRDVVHVVFNDREYLVGKEIRDEMIGNDFGRDMTDAYYDSAVYHSLMRGALIYMGEKRIDSLCLGLPMNHHTRQSRQVGSGLYRQDTANKRHFF